MDRVLKVNDLNCTIKGKKMVHPAQQHFIVYGWI